MGDDASHCISDGLELFIQELGVGTILELGSGAGTQRLADAGYKMISIEHDEKFVGLHPSDYIYAPIRPFRKPCAVFKDDTGWYDREAVQAGLEGQSYDLILVDGPPNYIGRGGFYKYKVLFNLDVPIILDDAHRPRVIQILQRLSAHLCRPYTVHGAWDDRHFGVILP